MPLQSNDEIVSRVRSLLVMATVKTGGKKSSKKEDNNAKKWKDLFLKYDSDKTGTMEYSEIKMAVRKDLRLSDRAVPDRDLKLLFNRIDTDGSGTLTFSEFYEFVCQGKQPGDDSSINELLAKVSRALRLAMRRLRLLKFKRLYHEEFLKVYNEFDQNNDGALSPAEMRGFFREALKLSSHEVSDVNIMRTYNFIDEDNSRSISVEELEEFIDYCLEIDEAKEQEATTGRGKKVVDRELELMQKMRLKDITVFPSNARAGCFSLNGRELVPRIRLALGAPTGSCGAPVKPEPPSPKPDQKPEASSEQASLPSPQRPPSPGDPPPRKTVLIDRKTTDLLDSLSLDEGAYARANEPASSSQPAAANRRHTVSTPALPQIGGSDGPRGAGEGRVHEFFLPGEKPPKYRVVAGAQTLNRIEQRVFEAGIDVRGHFHVHRRSHDIVRG